MMKAIEMRITILCIFIMTSLLNGCGSAEAIKSYHYQTTKYNLEKAVREVIKTNPNIYHDSAKENKSDSIMEKAGSEHSVADSAFYYNDGKNYVTIKIKIGQVNNDYIIRYLGDEQNWENSRSSAIFISAVHDKYRKGISQGHNENGEFSSTMAKQFIYLFETEFVNKIDKILNLKHTEE